MALLKAKDLISHDDGLDKDDFSFDNYSVYAGDDKVGSIDDVLVDENNGTIRYFIVDTGFWVMGKKVLLPVGLGRIESSEKRIYVNGLTKEQVENLPKFSSDMKLDETYEEQVRGVYRPMTPSYQGSSTTSDVAYTSGIANPSSTTAEMSTPVDMSSSADIDTTRSMPDLTTAEMNVATGTSAAYGSAYDYDREPDLYRPNVSGDQTIRLYEERLRTYKDRVKAGEVAIGKHVETRTEHVAVPVEKERVVIERTAPGDVTGAVDPNYSFDSGEVARVEVYEETAQIEKQPFVREEVRLRKEVTRETVETDAELRREEIDINTDGNPIINDANRRDR